eukprot:m.81742 g.81742  ORF g.81742 m.81742 type:complete len:380 (+) comp14703_c0_seq1:380-1519(+)
MATSGEQGAADSNELSFLSLPAALRQAAIAAGCGQQARDQLQQAITALDTAQVQETLAAHPDVATCDLDFNGTRSLHVVSELSALADTLPAFCQPSAINTQDGVGCTPLHCAAQTGNHEAIAVLLKAGADSSMVNCMCQTPLQVACVNGSLECVKLLMEGPGRNHLHTPDSLGRTALHLAARAKGERIVRALLDAGADPLICDARGETPLHLAAMRAGNAETVRLLAEASPQALTLLDDRKRSVLARAAMTGDCATVLVLLHAAGFNSRGQCVVAIAVDRLRHDGQKVQRAAVLDMLLAAGGDMRPLALPDLEDAGRCGSRVASELFFEWTQACSLKQLCRAQLRRSLGPSHLDKIRRMPLPPSCKEFLMYDHLHLLPG